MFEFMLAEKAHYPVRVLCRALDVSPSGYYAWRGRPLIPPRVRANLALRLRLRVLHADHDSCYGSPRLHRALRDAGEHVGRNRVIRGMRLEGLRGRLRRRFRATTQPDAQAAPAPNRLQQQFHASAPNTVWASDITAIPTDRGWLYLAVILDLWSRRVVGWATRTTLDTELVCAAWQLAVTRRRPGAGLIHHSDRGCQYTSARYQRRLRAQGAVCSMSRCGNCWDNAPVESFFRTLKVELGVRRWPTRQAATAAIARYIERFYNTRRLHSTLDYRSPAAFEAQHAA